MPNPVVAIIGAGATLGGAYMSSRAASKAARAQRYGADAATAAQMEMYYQNREDLAPWREAGGYALNQLQGMLKRGPGEFKESPGYQFRLGQGTQALERGAAARGKQLSGAQQKALTRFGQEYGAGEYQNFLNRYQQKLNPYLSMAGMGQTAAGQTAAAGTAVGAGMGQGFLAGGQARASGYINKANIWGGALGQGANALLYYQLLRGQGQNQLGGQFGSSPGWGTGSRSPYG